MKIQTIKDLAVKTHDADVLANVFCIATTAMVMASNVLNPLSGDPALVSPPPAWTPTTLVEVALGAAGGLGGGLAFAFATKMKDAANIATGSLLAAMWAGLLGPILVHAGMLVDPRIGGAATDPLITVAAGAVIGAGGMPFYLVVLAFFDALKTALPEIVSQIADWIIPGRKK